MILSTSSSRAVSINTGRSPLARICLHTSTPSMSGSIRSSTTSAGFSDWTSLSASVPLAVVRTLYPAFFRYAATNDAIDASSSTTRTVCGLPAMPDLLTDRADRALLGLGARQRDEVLTVQRVPTVAVRRVGLAGEPNRAGPDRDDIDAGAVDEDGVRPADCTELEAGAVPD